MSASFEIVLPPETRGFIQQMAGMPEAMMQAIGRGMARGGQYMLGEITRTNFTGQGPFPPSEHRLGVRTNRLRESLTAVAAQPLPTEVQGNVVKSTIGTNVRYFGVHEYGFDGEVNVKAHKRRLTLHADGGSEVFGIALAGKLHREGAVGKEISKGLKKSQTAVGEYEVPAYTRRMHVPERAPLRTGIAQHQNLLTEQITIELRSAWEGHSKS